MSIQVTCRHLDMTPSIQEHIEKKIAKLERHTGGPVEADVVLDLEKHLHKAEAKVHCRKGHFFAKSVSDDMYHSIDDMVNKLDSQLTAK